MGKLGRAAPAGRRLRDERKRVLGVHPKIPFHATRKDRRGAKDELGADKVPVVLCSENGGQQEPHPEGAGRVQIPLGADRSGVRKTDPGAVAGVQRRGGRDTPHNTA